MNKCYHCGKGVLYGRSHTHHRGVAGGRWKKRAPKTRRIFQPNLQRVEIFQDGKIKRIKLCTKCLKRIKKDLADGKKPFLTLAKLTKKEEDKEKGVKEEIKKQKRSQAKTSSKTKS